MAGAVPHAIHIIIREFHDEEEDACKDKEETASEKTDGGDLPVGIQCISKHYLNLRAQIDGLCHYIRKHGQLSYCVIIGGV